MLFVQSDFDDTVTVGNVSTLVRDAFAPSHEMWWAMEEEYQAGMYSVEESNIRQFALIQATRREIELHVRRKVKVREGFTGFVDYCRSKGIGFVIVSSGLDLYINPTLEAIGMAGQKFYSGRATVVKSGIIVSYKDPDGNPLTQGIKESYVRYHKQAGNTVIYLGDGISDVKPAMEADFVIARSTLRDRLVSSGLQHFPFETFHHVRQHLDTIREQLGM